MKRIYNFNAGPSAMPLEVLQQVQAEFLDFDHTGMSVVEISHRSKAYQNMQDETQMLLRKLLDIPDTYKIAFMQGGGSLQFLMHGANFLKHKGGYLNTGVWSQKAKQAASFYGEVYDVASSESEKFNHIPPMNKQQTFAIDPDTDYVYLTSNNTIYGTAWQRFPMFDVPLIADMSSDFLSRPIPIEQFDYIYAGVQKNVGPAGCVIGIIKEDFLAQANDMLPDMLKYKTFFDNDSTYNTPPVFCIYFVNRVLRWLEANGGLGVMEAKNKAKAKLIYDVIDESDGFYKGHATLDSRSLMNITFNLETPELEAQFVAAAAKRDIIGVKGHRSVGGCRASTYNAVPMEACEALAQFMRDFQRQH